jgi:DNA helicase-2/ATP-dependent DNA helicase PcrA
VIAHNVARKGKTLWSERDAGASLVFALTPDETFEARRVRHWLEHQQARGRSLQACAVLYRTNAQSRALETELRQVGMPYEIVGGVSFFQRREVKDVLAYLRLAVNPLDTVSFFRVWNTPRRGLGPMVEAQLRSRLALACGPRGRPALAPPGAVCEARPGPGRPGSSRCSTSCATGSDRWTSCARLLGAQRLHGAPTPRRGGSPKRANGENWASPPRGSPPPCKRRPGQFRTAGVARDVRSLTDADRVGDGDRVLLLTVHNAKGLEFDAPVAGLEEGLMPHARRWTRASSSGRSDGSTSRSRARDEVLLTAAAYRRRYDGAVLPCRAS